MERIDPAHSVLLVVDVQERLATAIPAQQLDQLQRGASILIEAADAFGVPVLWTEQYPKGLGKTIAPLQARLGMARARRFEKTAFSACGAAGLSGALDEIGARTAIVVGMEAHVCVFQTVRDLRGGSREVHVPIDGVASRRSDHRQAGLRLCERAGALLTTSETIVFDWLQSSESQHFKRISKLLR